MSQRSLRRALTTLLAGLVATTGLAAGPAPAASADPTSAAGNPTPVVSYTFDADTGTTVLDATSAHHDGSWVGTPEYGPGISGRAARVSNKTNEVVLPRIAGRTDGTGSFSYNFWIKQESFTSDSWIFTNIGGSSCDAGLGLYNTSGSGGRLTGCIIKGGLKVYQSNWNGASGINGAWHQIGVAVDRSAQTLKWYYDGVLKSTTALDDTVDLDSGQPFTFGGDAERSYAPYVNAWIDAVNFYDVALSDAQMAADFAATNPASHFPVTVTDDGHGTGSSSLLTPTAGASVTLTARPATGYHLDRWVPVTPAGLVIAADGTFVAPGVATTVKAQFAPNRYAVAYDGNGADGGAMAPQPMTYDTAAPLRANAFTRAGQQFAGWSTVPDGPVAYADAASVTNLASAQDATTTLYARWVPAGSRRVVVRGDAQVTVSASSDVTGFARPGDVVTLSSTPNLGYHAAWDSTPHVEVTADGTFTMPDADLEVRAVSTPNTYTVRFDGNGADGGTTAAQPMTYGQAATLRPNGFTRAGWAFRGWSRATTGARTWADGASVTDLSATDGATVVLHAVWNRLRTPGDTIAPVVSYDFEEITRGVVADSSGNGYDATFTGTVARASGISGRAAHVSAGTNVIKLPLVAGVSDGSGSFSVSGWFGVYDKVADAPLVSNGDFSACANGGLTLFNDELSAKTGFCWGNGSGTKYKYQQSPTAIKGSWHHLVMVVDREAATVRQYVDGVAGTPVPIAAGSKFTTGLPFVIGNSGKLDYHTISPYFGTVDALVDDFDLYDAALSPAQVQATWAATRPASAALPVDGAGSALPTGFVTDTFFAPQVRTGATWEQKVAGLWTGEDPVTTWTKVGGPSWADVSATGVVSGRAPARAPQQPAEITIEASDGTTTSSITVVVPVIDGADAPRLSAATWNLWDGGSHVASSLAKELAVIATNGLDVIGVQEDGGEGAQALADALGWHSYEGGTGLGIVSAYPLSDLVPASAGRPVAGATLDVAGVDLRVWTTDLDEAGYGPHQACLEGVTDPAALVAAENGSTRMAQARAVATAIEASVAAADDLPVVLLGDLASPSGADWTAATAASHCGVGAVDWPVVSAILGTGLTDSFRAAHPDPAADPGDTWSPVVRAHGDQPEPQDRIDYVAHAGALLEPVDAGTLVAGWPSSTDIVNNSWTSDHRAVVGTFTLGTPLPAVEAPSVAVEHDAVAYQVVRGPADDAALLADLGASADPAGATLAVDDSEVDYGTVGDYTALVSATRDGVVSDPVAVLVQVVPALEVRLAQPEVSLRRAALTEASVLAASGALLNVPGELHVDLAAAAAGPGTYRVTVTGTDRHGFTATAVVQLEVTGASLRVSVDPAVPDGDAGWYRTRPTVTLSAEEAGAPAPGLVLEWRVAGGDGEWTRYAGPLAVADGEQTWQVRARDDGGVSAAPVDVDLAVDTLAPVTTGSVAPGATGTAPVVVELSASDATSGVAATQYRLGGGTWTTYQHAFEVTPTTADQQVSFRSTDAAGNLEVARSLTIPAADLRAPTLSVGVAPATPDGAAGWYLTSPRVTATATDDVTPDPTIEVRTDGGAWTAYDGALAVADGEHALELRASDQQHNVSAPVAVDLRVDTVAPTVAADLVAGTTRNDPATVTVTATDATSGVAGVEYRIGQGPWTPYDTALVLTPGAAEQVVTYRATDVAGHTAGGSVRIPAADHTAPALSVGVLPAVADGAGGWWVTAPTITASATDDLTAAPVVEYRVGDGPWTAYPGPLVAADGTASYGFRARDELGNTSGVTTVPVRVDRIAPATVSQVATDAGGATLTLTATDATSGVASTQYAVDGGPVQVYGGPFRVVPDAAGRTVSFWSVDAAGNVETAGRVVVGGRDSTPPTVTAGLDRAPDGAGGWHRTRPGLVASADEAALLEYRVAGGPWSPYTGPVGIPDGRRTYEVRATDAAGNISPAVVVPAAVDTTAPGLRPRLRLVRRHGRVVARLDPRAADATSGVARVEYRAAGRRWRTARGPIVLRPAARARTVRVRVTDGAGNLAVVRVRVPARR